MTLYDGDPCDGLAEENITSTVSSLNKKHLLELQHCYYSLELLVNEIV
jgi:hypothetical protein